MSYTKIKRLNPENKEFAGMLLAVCLPIIFQNFIGASVNLIDSIMVGRLGDIAVASVGLSNQVFFILNLIMLGISSGIAIFMTQYWGKKDYEGLHKSIAFGFVIIFPIMILATCIALIVPGSIISIFTPDRSVIIEGAKYLRVVSLSYIPIAVSVFLGYALRSTDRVKYSVYVTFFALVLNVILNYFLIFGIWIFPELGIVGAAIATVIARYIQLIMLLLIIYGKKMPVAITELTSLKFNLGFIKRFIKTSGNVLLNEVLFGIGTALLFAVYGLIGTDIVAGANIAKTIENLVWIFFWSFCAAASVSIGKLIGSEEYKKAQRYAWKFIITGTVSGIVLSGLLLILTNPLLSLFNVSESAISAARIYIILFAIFILIRGPLKILTGGVLRAGGDTTFVLLWDVIPLWITLVVLYVCTENSNISVTVVFLLAISYEMIKVIPTLLRIKSGEWKNNLVS